MKKAIMILSVIAMIQGCTQPVDATRILSQNGYTEIRTTGYDWFGCSKDDTYADGFVAKSPAGVEVEGVVCAGLIAKGATIRLY